MRINKVDTFMGTNRWEVQVDGIDMAYLGSYGVNIMYRSRCVVNMGIHVGVSIC